MITKINVVVTIFLFYQFVCVAQQKQAKSILSKIGYDNYLLITVEHHAERYSSKEVNLFYSSDSIIKVHSIFKSTNENENIDTVFVLNGTQLTALQNFDNEMKSAKCPEEGIVTAGSWTSCTINLDKETYTNKCKRPLSLIKKLIELKK